MLSTLIFVLASMAPLDPSAIRKEMVALAPSAVSSPRTGAHRLNVNEATRSFVIDVKVTFEDEILYNGPLRLAPGFVTTYSQVLRETPALICRGGERYQSTDKRSLHIQLSQWHNESEPIHVMVEFVRPAGLAGCEGAGTRTARTEQWLDFGPRESVALPGGKEGLGVSLSRR